MRDKLREQGNLPNLVIIGAMKCGTSSLHRYLDLHPQIKMSSLKELDFFITEKNWNKGEKWYQSNFPHNAEILGESSPNYTKYPTFKGVPERMHSLIPDAKLIYLVRDPIKRVVSHYTHQYTDRVEKRSLAEALVDLQNNHYVNCSRYGMQINQFLSYFQLDQILVVSLEDLSRNRCLILKKIFSFLGVDESFIHPDFMQVFHQSAKKKRLTDFGDRIFKFPFGGRLLNVFPNLMVEDIKSPKISIESQERLCYILKDDIEYFRKITKQTFSEWLI